MGTNTEKPTTKAEQKKQGIVKAPKKQEAPKPQTSKTEAKKPAETKSQELKTQEQDVKAEGQSSTPDSTNPSERGDKTKPKEKPKFQSPKVKKDYAFVRGVSLPISMKKSKAICKFIKGKKIEKAISDLEEVIVFKKHVPIVGEVPHKKGYGKAGSGSGSYPIKASKQFIKLLRSLRANSDINGLDNPFIAEASANLAQRPFGRFGRWKRKRTHIKIIVREKKEIMKNKKSEKKIKEKNDK